jgi:hypothetical protein
MARFEMDGFDELLAEMKRMGELSGETADKMLMAGAEQAKQAWKESAERQNLKDTTDMINSIGYSRAPKTAGDIRTIDIYPQGKDRKGVRNAEKAFILNYGTKGSSSANAQRKRRKKDKRPGPGIPATHWVDDADTASGEPVMQAMTRIWDEHLKGNT